MFIIPQRHPRCRCRCFHRIFNFQSVIQCM